MTPESGKCPHCGQDMPVKSSSGSIQVSELFNTILRIEKFDLDDWDRSFLASIKRQRTLSYRQQQQFMRIEKLYLKKEPSGEMPDGDIPF